MRRLLFTFLIILLSSAAIAQPVYVSGYVIKPNGDTLKGYIKYPDYFRWAQCPTYIRFKTDTNDNKALRFNPHTVREFHVDGHETYITYAGLVSADANTFNIAGFALDTSKRQDTIFLKIVTQGKYLALFYQNDGFKTRYFISENSGPPIELVYHLYYDNPNRMIAKPTYSAWLVSLINKYAPGNKRLMIEISEMSFSQASFEDFVDDINNLGKQP